MKMLKTILENHPSFQELEREHLKFVIDNAENIEFKAEELLFKEGEKADKLYIIQSGKIAIELFTPSRGSITIQTLGLNEIVGWSLTPPYQRSFDARCVEDSQAISIDGKALRIRCEEDSKFGYELLKNFTYTVVQRLQRTRIQLLDIYKIRT